MQLFALLGGYQSTDSPYDPMFTARDADGQFTSRLDIVSAMIDWWDDDEQRTVFDPGRRASAIATGGSEDDIYGAVRRPVPGQERAVRLARRAAPDPRLQRRLLGDVRRRPDPDDPRERKVTVYASGAVNVNQAKPEVLLARLCPFVSTRAAVQRSGGGRGLRHALQHAAQHRARCRCFPRSTAFLDFVSGGAGKSGGQAGGRDIYAMLSMYLTAMGQPALMAWTPVTIPKELRAAVATKFLVEAYIFTIQSTAHVGRAQAKMSMVTR